MKVTPGSKASLANLSPGDVILAIDGVSTDSMAHVDAQNRIKAASTQLSLKIDRPETKLWSPQVTEGDKANPFKINLEAEPQEIKSIGESHNRKAQPFLAAGNIGDKKQVVSSSYNTPIGLYTADNIQDALQGQLRGMVIESQEKTEPVPGVQHSEVYKMLHNSQEQNNEPRQSGSFRAIQDYLDSDESDNRPMVTRSVKAPVTKVGASGGSVQKLPLCDKCGNGIVGTVVKARDKFRHPECFVCSDCDMNLKQKGYFFIEGQLYCEAHARARTKPPEGYEAKPVYPNTKV
ncbi:PDZ and LIM domain protein 3-like isoform X2 [Narcine bancroftii]|uniref:PDZ and LIM domain protein 3-like isoform X2 n=1 Tax=Narcine bancroftii TaxID=1343680 RepID=UPI00383159B0